MKKLLYTHFLIYFLYNSSVAQELDEKQDEYKQNFILCCEGTDCSTSPSRFLHNNTDYTFKSYTNFQYVEKGTAEQCSRRFHLNYTNCKYRITESNPDNIQETHHISVTNPINKTWVVEYNQGSYKQEVLKINQTLRFEFKMRFENCSAPIIEERIGPIVNILDKYRMLYFIGLSVLLVICGALVIVFVFMKNKNSKTKANTIRNLQGTNRHPSLWTDETRPMTITDEERRLILGHRRSSFANLEHGNPDSTRASPAVSRAQSICDIQITTPEITRPEPKSQLDKIRYRRSGSVDEKIMQMKIDFTSPRSTNKLRNYKRPDELPTLHSVQSCTSQESFKFPSPRSSATKNPMIPVVPEGIELGLLAKLHEDTENDVWRTTDLDQSPYFQATEPIKVSSMKTSRKRSIGSAKKMWTDINDNEVELPILLSSAPDSPTDTRTINVFGGEYMDFGDLPTLQYLAEKAEEDKRKPVLTKHDTSSL